MIPQLLPKSPYANLLLNPSSESRLSNCLNVSWFSPFKQHFLNVWPGYLTTIRHHEDGFLLGVEIIHKVLRRDTALDVMDRMRQSGGDIQVKL